MTTQVVHENIRVFGNKMLQDARGNWDNVLWERLVQRVMKDYGYGRFMAEQIMDQALGFLTLVARNPGVSYSPAPLPDIGWHTFLLYTREYAAFCDRTAGRFIHHAPFDGPDAASMAQGVVCPVHTADAMHQAGIGVIDALWAPRKRSFWQRLLR